MLPEDLNKFAFQRVIGEDAFTRSLVLLGSLPSPDDHQTRAQAIIRIERTALDTSKASSFFSSDTNSPGLIQRTQLDGNTDIVRVPRIMSSIRQTLVFRSTHGFLDGSERVERKMSR